ncbi:MAG: hypothetical protein N2249_07610 [Melioribacter sp.]|nr:hypothetical protein [Melioribacter sp.]
MKKLSFFLLLLFSTVINSQESKVIEAEVKVHGNCGQCKSRIENALKIKEVKFARWDRKTKILKVVFDSSKISLDSLMHRVAIAGHDNEKFKADDSVYKKLPKCCLYRDSSNTH